MEQCRIGRFVAPMDRAYHPVDHTWVRFEDDGARIGMDSLGVETAGDLAQLFLLPPGSRVEQGDEMGSVEAQKFVGALRAPVAGVVVAVNDAVIADPRLVSTDPYEKGWLAIVRPDDGATFDHLIHGDEIPAWFEASLEEYRRQGSVAE